MHHQIVQKFNVIGIPVRTTNEGGQSGKDIRVLWEKFRSEEVAERIPHKLDNTVYSVYTDYEGDYNKPYTTILGCKVENLDEVPEGMVGKVIETGDFARFTASGSLLEGVVFKEWGKIWNMDLRRLYTADFEVYGEKAQDPECAEVDIFVGVERQG